MSRSQEEVCVTGGGDKKKLTFIGDNVDFQLISYHFTSRRRPGRRGAPPSSKYVTESDK